MSDTTAVSRRLRCAGIAAFGAMAAMRACDAMLLTLAGEFGRSVGDASHVISVFAISYGLLQVFYGPLGDRIGKLRVVAFASAACAASSIVVAMAPTLDALVIGRALMGGAAAGVIPLTMAWVGDNVPYEQRQETLAKLLGATVSGMIAGQWLGAWITETLGWRQAFWALTVVFAAAAWWLRTELTGHRDDVHGPSELAPGRPTQAPGLTNPLTLLRNARVRWVLGVTALEGALVFGSLAFIPSHLSQHFALSTSSAGAVLALYGVGGLVYSRCAKRLLRWMGERGLATAGGTLLGIALLTLSWARHWLLALPACLLAGMAFYMLHSTLQTQATQMAPARRGAAVSLFSCALFFGQSIGVVVTAMAVDQDWTRWCFSVAAIALVVLGSVVGRGVASRIAQAVQAP
ncbi:MFS transporter [Azohydromonas australica]|uniref:MFS transporter n=1 Tax=Azohydromonas australica TaxID=364039 RepID=UPI000408D6F5|nr:MFS transporter [Azohydromonas australica]